MRPGCEHRRSQITDSRFHGAGYAVEHTRTIFCDSCRLYRWLEVEAALALAQADCGVIPEEAARQIASAARRSVIDEDRVERGIIESGHSLIALIAHLEEASGAPANGFVHYGATTQDIQDTAQALEMAEVLEIAEALLADVLTQLMGLAEANVDQPMLGRTHSVAALPITFGLKVAGWIDELLRQLERIQAMRPRVLVGQLFGGTGTMAALGPPALQVLERFCERLGLGVPRCGWHVARDRVAEFVSSLASLTTSLARVSNEIYTLARYEFGELVLRYPSKAVGSSTMPHKKNPEGCEQIVALARLTRVQVPLSLDAMIQGHERDYRGTRLEWAAVADVSHYSVAALSLMCETLRMIEVDGPRMCANLDRQHEAVCREAVMMRLADQVGKQSAYDLVAEASRQAERAGISLRDQLVGSDEVVAALGERSEIDRLLDPALYLGRSRALVARVVDACRAALASASPS